MDLTDLFGSEPVLIDLRAEDRWQAIEELALVVAKRLRP
jgi:hypothetical protein